MATYRRDIIHCRTITSHGVEILDTFLVHIDSSCDPVHTPNIDGNKYKILGENINLQSASFSASLASHPKYGRLTFLVQRLTAF